jgi:citrate lyase subunit beta/citryl-CoA lyase
VSISGPFRSLLFAPGNHTRRVEKALMLDADAVILDLEDAVALAEKTATRSLVRTALQAPRPGLAYVRVNAIDTEFCHGDIAAVVGPGLDGIMLPKVESADHLLTIDWLLSQFERDGGVAVGSVDLLPIVETGRGIANAREIAVATSRVRRLSFGAGDYSRDMGMRWTTGEAELTSARAEVVLASRVAGIEPPLDTVWVSGQALHPSGSDQGGQRRLHTD